MGRDRGDILVFEGIQCDFRQWPLAVISSTDQTTEKSLEAFLDAYRTYLERKQERFAVVVDVRTRANMNSKQRRIMTAGMARNKAFNERYCACTALVFESVAIRGVLLAVLWVFKPAYPTQVFKNLDEAVAWAKTQL